MRKAKVITVLALTVVMLVVMTGISAASDEFITITPLHANNVPIDGSTYTYAVNITTNAAGDHYLEINTSSAEIEARIKGPTGSSDGTGYTSNTSAWTTTSTTSVIWGATNSSLYGTTYYFDLEVRAASPPAPEGLYFTVNVHDNEGTTYQPLGAVDEAAEGTTHGTTIPEFVTIALPALSILGLFLFYNHRKRKEE